MSDEKNDQVSITVKSADSEVVFRIKRTTPLGKLMNSYCERQGKSLQSVRFLFDGKRIEAHNTPNELEIEEGDIIEATVEQQGGGELETAEGDKETHLNIKVVSNDGEVYFKVRKTTPFLKLMNAFCTRQSKSMDSVKFLLNGQRINPTDTPESLDMDEGDTIDVVMQQTGGGDASEESETHINLRVVSEDGQEVHFKIRRNAPMLKLMNAFCTKKGKSIDSVKFMCDGKLMNKENTAKELDMEDGDTIEVVMQQTGGQ